MIELFFAWWPIVAFALTSLSGGLLAYADLRGRVKAAEELQAERYNVILRDIKRLDEKVESLTDFLLRVHGKS